MCVELEFSSDKTSWLLNYPLDSFAFLVCLFVHCLCAEIRRKIQDGVEWSGVEWRAQENG